MTELAYGDFDATKESLLLKDDEESFKPLSQSKVQANEVIQMTSYKSNEIIYNVESNFKRLAVFSEVFFADGWKAFVNDAEVKIHEVNYILRGIAIPEGSSKVRFVFEPEKFGMFNTVSMISSLLVLLALIGLFRKPKEA
jgi:uncharacterized membrane protein YfhO